MRFALALVDRVTLPNHFVILTKVRIQGNGWYPVWLWVLTFVRMTVGVW